jgi:trans-aconitate 2-methyltransferase
MEWSPEQYNRFSDERRQPFEDLWRLVHARAGLSVVDLGCGTGELTRELAERLPGSQVLGLDSSEQMLARARRLAQPGLCFELRRIEELEGSFDLIFSNAALHWVDDHRALFPRLLARLRAGGQLLSQMPSNHGHPAHRLAGELAGEEPFRSALSSYRRRTEVLPVDEYAALLHEAGARELQVLEKVYLHVLADAAAVAEWTRATTLLPYLARLGGLADEYLARYRDRLARLMPQRPLLYTFRRILLSARARDGAVSPGSPA